MHRHHQNEETTSNQRFTEASCSTRVARTARPARALLVTLARVGTVLAVTATATLGACSGLRSGQDAIPDTGEGPPDQSSPVPRPDSSGADDAATAPETGAEATPDAADAADEGPSKDDPGPLEPVVGALAAGLGISVSQDHVYWLEKGDRASGGNYFAVFRRRGLTLPACALNDNCGTQLPMPGSTYFGDTHIGTLSSDAMTCFNVIANGARDTAIRCFVHGGSLVLLANSPFASSVRAIVGTDLYFSVPPRPGFTTTSLRRWSVATPTVAPVDVLTRTAFEFRDLVVEGDALFWTEAASTGESTVFFKKGAADPVEVAPARPGPARLTVDASFLYVTRLTSGTIERYPRTPTGAGAGVEIATAQLGVGPILRRGAYLLWLNYGPAPDYTASQIVRAKRDGTEQVVLDSDETITGFAATPNTAYAITFGKAPTFIGTVKRIRFTR